MNVVSDLEACDKWSSHKKVSVKYEDTKMVPNYGVATHEASISLKAPINLIFNNQLIYPIKQNFV